MKKLFSFLLIASLFSCSTINFDRSMPLMADRVENFSDLSGTYDFTDSTVKIKDEVFYNSNYYVDAYKKRDSITLISGIIYFENQQMGYKIHLKAYYNMNKVDTVRLKEKYKKATAS